MSQSVRPSIVDHGKELQRQRVLFNNRPNGTNLDTYWKMLRNYMISRNVSEADIMKNVHLTLGDEPEDWYWSRFHDSADKSFAEYQRRLFKRYDKFLIGGEIYSQAMAMKFQSGDIRAHVDKVVTLLNRGAFDEPTKLEAVMAGLTDEVQRIAKMQRVKTLIDLDNVLADLFPKLCIPSKNTERRFNNYGRNDMKNFIHEVASMQQESESSTQVSQDTSDDSPFKISQSNESPSEGVDQAYEPDSEAEFSPMEVTFCEMFNKMGSIVNNIRSNKKRALPGRPAKEFQESEIDDKFNIPKGCYHCLQEGHFHKTCPKEQTAFFCHGCSRRNTVKSRCPTRKCVMAQRSKN